MTLGSKLLQGFPSWSFAAVGRDMHGGGGAPCSSVSSKVTVHVSLIALCSPR